VVGRHDGFARYTVGQRRGLPGGFAQPMFVTAIRPEQRAVVIGPRAELLGRGLVAREVNWLGDEPRLGTRVDVQIRHRAAPVPGEVIRLDTGEVELALEAPVAAIAPGQSVVMYQGERALGGGVIESGKRDSGEAEGLVATGDSALGAGERGSGSGRQLRVLGAA
jgi:tRNA-uridine 2-sulfurtransferase